jgi:serine/threonine-protein kinase
VQEGTTIGTYRVLSKLGEGGMGAVYVGEHTLLGRKAAIKVLLPELSAHKEIVQRFFNEAKAVTQITDPGIVQVFDFGYDQSGVAYIVMELLEGEPMDRRLQRIGRIAPPDALRLAKQICTSLQAAHNKGIIHRDLKPENIYIVGDPAVTGGERAKILDFGIAKLSGDEPGKMKTRTGMVMGTPVYMSPEQCRGAGVVDARSDIYSFACVLMTMVTGKPPFDGSGSGELIVAHMREAPPLAASRVQGMPPVIDQILQRGLQKDPAHRFQTMSEFAQAIGAAEAQILGFTPPPVGGNYYSPTITPGQYMAQQTPGQPYPGYPTPGQPYQSQPTPGQPYQGHHTPYQQQPTPAPPKPTTLSSATSSGTQPPTKSKGGLIAVIAGAAIAGVVAVVLVMKGGKHEETAAAGAGGSAGSDGSAEVHTPPPPAADAALAVTPPPVIDAAAVTATATVDAGVADAAAAVAKTTTVDAGVAPKQTTKTTTTTQKHSSGGKKHDTSNAGSVDRGD